MTGPSKEAADLAARFKRIKKLSKDLAAAQADSSRQQALVDRLRRKLDAARLALQHIK